MHQVVSDRECRLACSERDASGDNFDARLNLSLSSMIKTVYSSTRPSLSFWSARIASDMDHRDPCMKVWKCMYT